MNKLTNWLLERYKEDELKKIKDFVDAEWEAKLHNLKLDFGDRNIREVLWEMIFTYDVKGKVNKKERYRIYNKLQQDKDFEKLFRSKYAKNYMAYFNAKNDRERDMLKGRMLELLDTLNTMDIAKSKLDNWDEVERLEEKKIKLKKDLQEKFLTN